MENRKPLISKQLTVIHNFNQIVKHVMNRYYLFSNGFMIPTDGGSAVTGGLHFCVAKDIQPFMQLLPDLPEGHVYIIDTRAIYDAFQHKEKGYKKEIVGICINEGKLCFETGMFLGTIGEVVKADDTMANNLSLMISKFKSINPINVKQSFVTDLLDNKLMTFSEGDYRFRLTKAVLPNLKPVDELSIAFYDTDNPEIFEAIVALLKKGDIFTIHMYLCGRF